MPKAPNILLIALDQLRPDHLSCYGYWRATSPHIDELARRGVLFKAAYSPASWTTPSFVSLMTSLYPSRHRLTLFLPQGLSLLDHHITLLPEVFQGAGYRTVAFVNNGNAGRQILDRGFEEFYQGQEAPPNITERLGATEGAPSTTEKASFWLEQWKRNPDAPFFMFLLYFEPHSPYIPPPEHDIFKTDAYPSLHFTGYDPKGGYLLRLATLGDPLAIQRLNSLYDGYIHFVDHHFGRLLANIRQLGLEEETIICLLSDHGELLYEHPDVLTFDHRSLYDANIRIPLILAGPGIPQGRVIHSPVALLDVAPTLLELAGLPSLPQRQGESLLPLMEGISNRVREHIFSEQDISERLRAVRGDRYKLIYNLDSGKILLFDLWKDPAEHFDISSQEPQKVRELMKPLEEWMEENHPPEEERLALWRRIVEGGPRSIIIDETTIGAQCQLYGKGWRMAEEDAFFNGACFWAEPDPYGSKIAIWRSDNPLLGVYNVYIWFGKLSNIPSATNAPFRVVTRHGEEAFPVNQNEDFGRWVHLGEFEDPLYVRLDSRADGPIVVDAVKFERV